MAEVGARPRWRDALVLAVLATVVVGGLVHYGRGLDGGGTPSESPSAPHRPMTPPPPRAPRHPAAPAVPPGGGRSWDGREIAKLKLCRGLEWVFPSFAEDRALCTRARPQRRQLPRGQVLRVLPGGARQAGHHHL